MTRPPSDVRDLLKPATSITLIGTADTTFPRTFQIHGLLSQNGKVLNSEGLGASAVCYEANHRDSGIGTLKEFYPRNAFYLKRNDEGQLLLSRDAPQELEDFQEKKKQYLAPFRILNKIRQRQTGKEIGTFIPHFELYDSNTPPGEEGTVYVWSPAPAVEPFDKICERIHNNPQDKPEENLSNVLYAIKSLTQCIKLLHAKGLYHRDINPRNFGFMYQEGKPVMEGISLFDVNTFLLVGQDDGMRYSTEGYTEPEESTAEYQHFTSYEVSYQTDIFAIGATLFHAIVVNDRVKATGYRYRKEYYDDLEELVAGSELIQGAEPVFQPGLREALVKILQNCLAPREKRYQSCKALQADLEEALKLASRRKDDSLAMVSEKLFDTGKSYDTGKGRERNYTFAAEWFTHAAELGHARAQYSLGKYYKLGQGVTQDYKTAAEWYTEAAKQGDVDAQFCLALLYSKGQGVARNHEKAVEWYTKAAKQGDAAAQNNLGVCYDKGRGVMQDYKKAVEWFTKAAEQGNAKAQFNLALRYDKGQGVTQDYEKAVEWYTKAAEQGAPGAQV